jgi:hypothetical protein
MSVGDIGKIRDLPGTELPSFDQPDGIHMDPYRTNLLAPAAKHTGKGDIFRDILIPLPPDKINRLYILNTCCKVKLAGIQAYSAA